MRKNAKKWGKIGKNSQNSHIYFFSIFYVNSCYSLANLRKIVAKKICRTPPTKIFPKEKFWYKISAQNFRTTFPHNIFSQHFLTTFSHNIFSQHFLTNPKCHPLGILKKPLFFEIFSAPIPE